MLHIRVSARGTMWSTTGGRRYGDCVRSSPAAQSSCTPQIRVLYAAPVVKATAAAAGAAANGVAHRSGGV